MPSLQPKTAGEIYVKSSVNYTDTTLFHKDLKLLITNEDVSARSHYNMVGSETITY